MDDKPLTSNELREVLKEFFNDISNKKDNTSFGNQFDKFDKVDDMFKGMSFKETVDEIKKKSKQLEDGTEKLAKQQEKMEELYDKANDLQEKMNKARSEDEKRGYENLIKKHNEKIKTEEANLKNIKDSNKATEDAIEKGKNSVGAKVQKVGSIITNAAKLIEYAINIWAIIVESNIKREETRLKTANALVMTQINVYGNALNKLSSLAAGNIARSTKENAYASLDAVREGSRAYQMKKLEDEYNRRQKEIEMKKIRNSEVSGLLKEGGVAVSTVAALAVGAAVGSIIPVIGTAVGAAVGAVVGLAVNVWDKITGISIKKQELALEQQKMVNEQTKRTMEKFHNVVKNLDEVGKKINDKFLDYQDTAYKKGRAYGLSPNNLNNYAKGVFGVNKTLAALGLNEADYYKMQDAYAENSLGRNPIISGNEALLMGGLGKLMNLEPSEISSITGVLSEFNVSIDSGTQMIYEMSDEVMRMGLNTTKFGKDLVKNLKYAEKFQFKDGTKGLMEMAAWAQKMRVDMGKFMSAMDKFHTGNIEDVMQASAKLNVLGGNAALMSDPMGMLYNAYANPTQFAKNIANMVAGFGTFNKRTGETDFNINESMRMEAMASAMGMSREDFFNMARQSKKESEIKRKFGKKFGNKTDFVTQNATWSKDKKDWIIKVQTGVGEFEEKKLSDLTGENDKALENIFPEDKQDQLIDLVKNIYDRMSGKEQLAVADASKDSTLLVDTYGTLRETNKKLADETMRHAEKMREFYDSVVTEFSQTILNTQRETNKTIEEHKGNLLSLYKKLNVDSVVAYSLQVKEMFTGDSETSRAREAIMRSDAGRSAEAVASFAAQNYDREKKANDLIISPKHGVWRTDPDDTILAMKPGGSIDRSTQRREGNPENINLNINGTLMLNSNGLNLNLMEILRNDPTGLRDLTKSIISEASRNMFGGRGRWVTVPEKWQ